MTFMGLEFDTRPDVLVPQTETEMLARAALQLLPPHRDEPIIVLDVCCGAGNLAAVLADQRSDVRVEATDLTDACVALSRHNIARLGLSDRVVVHQGDLFESLRALNLEDVVDLVVCNPPYISSGKLDGESAHLLQDQPREAFDAGPYGLSIHRRVIRDAASFLRSGAWLAMEIGVGQSDQVRTLIDRSRHYDSTKQWLDHDGEPRVIAARRTASDPTS